MRATLICNRKIYNIVGDMHRFGVYGIKNIQNDRIYVGHTGNEFVWRWRQHIGQLTRNQHHCQSLQDDWNIYGSDSFEFVVLHMADTYDEIVAGIEAQIMRQYDNRYNIASGDGALESHTQRVGRKGRSGGLRSKTRVLPLDQRKASKSGRIALWLAPDIVQLILTGAQLYGTDDPEQVVRLALQQVTNVSLDK